MPANLLAILLDSSHAPIIAFIALRDWRRGMSFSRPENLQGCDRPFFSINRVCAQFAAFSIDKVYNVP